MYVSFWIISSNIKDFVVYQKSRKNALLKF